MADDASDKRRRSKKKRSSLLTWKKKFNIKKRFTNKLPVHRRHIRALMSGWSLSDVRSVLTQYEITTMLKQLSSMADKSRLPGSTLSQDLGEMYKNLSCCDLNITCCDMANEECLLNHTSTNHMQAFKTHRAFVSARWPYLRGLIKSQQLNKQKRKSMQENTTAGDDANTNESKLEQHSDLPSLKIHIAKITPEKLSEILNEVYGENKNGSSTPVRKLLPLPTTDDSLHIRNSRGGKQAFRYTIFEGDPPPVVRRSVGRRKHSKHRFSMDERILSSQHLISPQFSRGNQEIRSSRPSPSEVMQSHLNGRQFDKTNMHQTEKTIPNSIQDDILKMYQDAKSGCGDVKIVFSSDSSCHFTPWMTPHARRRDFSNHYQAWISHYESSNYFPSSSREWQDPVYCHKIVLAARSPYFRRLIEKQMSSPTWLESEDDVIPIIEIDGNVIPPRYMGAVLHTMYTDKVDIPRLYERIGQGGMPVGGIPNHFHLRDAMMLHHIGCFIEFPQLIYGCEEFIVSNLDQNNVPQVLHWSSLPHGSVWVKRQVNNFIRERFTELSSTGVLFELNASQIVEVLRSDFVNASELDILKCALRWGEHELLRRIEEREPNLLTHTAHSISRSKTASARRRDLIASRIEELHECTAPVLACVRMQHLLPPNHELFTNAEARGVISRPPADLLANVNDRESCSRQQWIKSRADFIPPRLFQPYMDETRHILDERFAQESDCVSLRSMHSFSRDQVWYSVRHQMELANYGIPDHLYMVGKARLPMRGRYGNRDPHLNCFPTRTENGARKVTLMKYIGDFYPVPEVSVLREMMARERELRSLHIVHKVLTTCIDCCHGNNINVTYSGVGYSARHGTTGSDSSSSHEDLDETEHCNRCTALRLVRLFVVRERGLPDCATDLLHRPELYYDLNELRGVAMTDSSRFTSVLRTDQAPRASGRLDSHLQSERRDDSSSHGTSNLHHKQRISSAAKSSTPPCFNESPLAPGFWRNQNQQHLDIPSSSCLNSNIPAALSLTESSSSSTSEDEEVVRVRRKKKSLSRRGSSSTTSYHSIPDVAASANSSLQRLRNSVPRTSEELPSSPLVTSNFNYAATDAALTSIPISQYFLKLTETETCDSTTSSWEENTSENDIERVPAQIGQNISKTAPIGTPGTSFRVRASHRNSPSEVYSQRVFARPQHESVRIRSQKIHPPRRRPLSAGMSELFQSSLNFIDDNIESSEDNSDIPGHFQPANFHPFQLDVPELVKDGTLPRAPSALGATLAGPEQRNSLSEKPDIYPAGSEAECSLEDQCGQYFFCSLTRERMSKSENGQKAKRSGTSFSFAINNEKPGSSGRNTDNKNGSANLAFVSDETIFL